MQSPSVSTYVQWWSAAGRVHLSMPQSRASGPRVSNAQADHATLAQQKTGLRCWRMLKRCFVFPTGACAPVAPRPKAECNTVLWTPSVHQQGRSRKVNHVCHTLGMIPTMLHSEHTPCFQQPKVPHPT